MEVTRETRLRDSLFTGTAPRSPQQPSPGPLAGFVSLSHRKRCQFLNVTSRKKLFFCKNTGLCRAMVPTSDHCSHCNFHSAGFEKQGFVSWSAGAEALPPFSPFCLSRAAEPLCQRSWELQQLMSSIRERRASP